MPRFDDNVEMPRELDDYFFMLLKPYCGRLTIACMDAAWEGIVRTLLVHVEREATSATLEAVRDA